MKKRALTYKLRLDTFTNTIAFSLQEKYIDVTKLFERSCFNPFMCESTQKQNVRCVYGTFFCALRILFLHLRETCFIIAHEIICCLFLLFNILYLTSAKDADSTH